MLCLTVITFSQSSAYDFFFQTSFVFSPLYFSVHLFFFIFFVNFCSQSSITRVNLPADNPPSISTGSFSPFCCFIFKFHFRIFLGFCWFLLFFFLFVLEGLVYFWFSLLLCWSWPRLPRGSSQTFWSRDEDGLTGASHCCGLMLLPRLVLRQRSPGENGRLGNQAWNIFCFLLLFFWIQPRHW